MIFYYPKYNQLLLYFGDNGRFSMFMFDEGCLTLIDKEEIELEFIGEL